MIPQHISASVELYTPAKLVEPARQLMGGIEFDPASCALGNEVVMADRFLTAEDGGLSQKWVADSVFLNPPGGTAPPNRVGTRSNAALWWWKLYRAWKREHVKQAIYIGFTLEIMSTTQGLKGAESVLKFPHAVARSRGNFDVPRPVILDDGTKLHEVKVPKGRKVVEVCDGAKRYPTSNATHANVIVYLPPQADALHRAGRAKAFADLFESVGECVYGEY